MRAYPATIEMVGGPWCGETMPTPQGGLLPVVIQVPLYLRPDGAVVRGDYRPGDEHLATGTYRLLPWADDVAFVWQGE